MDLSARFYRIRIVQDGNGKYKVQRKIGLLCDWVDEYIREEDGNIQYGSISTNNLTAAKTAMERIRFEDQAKLQSKKLTVIEVKKLYD